MEQLSVSQKCWRGFLSVLYTNVICILFCWLSLFLTVLTMTKPSMALILDGFVGWLIFMLFYFIMLPYNWFVKQNKIAAIINILFAVYYIVWVAIIKPWIEIDTEFLNSGWDYFVLIVSNLISLGILGGYSGAIYNFATSHIQDHCKISSIVRENKSIKESIQSEPVSNDRLATTTLGGKEITGRVTGKYEVSEDRPTTEEKEAETHVEPEQTKVNKTPIQEKKDELALETFTPKTILDVLDDDGMPTEYGRKIGVQSFEGGVYQVYNKDRDLEYSLDEGRMKVIVELNNQKEKNAIDKRNREKKQAQINAIKAERKSKEDAEKKVKEYANEEPKVESVAELSPTENPMLQLIKRAIDNNISMDNVLKTQREELEKLHKKVEKDFSKENMQAYKDKKMFIEELESAYAEYLAQNAPMEE